MMPVIGGLDAGMNEHVMKHIEVEKNKKVIHKVLYQ